MKRSRGSSATLDVSALESWLWRAACQIRGPLDAPKFKGHIPPLCLLKATLGRL
jgi:type I restriction enzyme M protein